jgi:hypothetical protein
MMDVDLRNILVAEDDPRDAELTLQALREHRLAYRMVVVKPVDFGESIDAVKQIGGFWALLNEPAPMGPPS